MECTILIDEYGESKIQVMNKTTGELMAATDIPGESCVDVLLRMNCQWFGGGKFGTKPMVTRVSVYPREDYLDTGMLTDEHVALAKAGEDIHTSDGRLIVIEKDEPDREAETEEPDDAEREEAKDDDFILGFSAK